MGASGTSPLKELFRHSPGVSEENNKDLRMT